MDILTIFYIILLLSASALCIALIIYVKRITASIVEIENDIKEMSSQLKPLLISSTNLSDKLIFLSEQAKEQIHVAKSIVTDVRDRVDKILLLEEKLRRGVEEPVTGLIKNLSAIFNGVNSFWKTYKKH
jgi:uncharacterized protein YoxC